MYTLSTLDDSAALSLEEFQVKMCKLKETPTPPNQYFN